jgi:hypothetical protein
LDFSEFIQLATRSVAHQRQGQVFMNTLGRFRPDIYGSLSGTAWDPFYDDRALEAAMNYVAQKWATH